MSDKKPDYAPKAIAEMVHAFLQTPLGDHYLQQLSLIYNGLHQEAESTGLTAEQKAMKVERAAGVKVAITYLTSRDNLLAQGHYKETPAEQ